MEHKNDAGYYYLNLPPTDGKGGHVTMEKVVELGFIVDDNFVEADLPKDAELLQRWEAPGRLVASEKEQWVVIRLPISKARKLIALTNTYPVESQGKKWVVTSQIPLTSIR